MTHKKLLMGVKKLTLSKVPLSRENVTASSQAVMVWTYWFLFPEI